MDSVLEDIRLGMEVNLPKFNQRRVAQVKYLGELYNYRMVESADIFKVCVTITQLSFWPIYTTGALLTNNLWSFNGPKRSITTGSAQPPFPN